MRLEALDLLHASVAPIQREYQWKTSMDKITCVHAVTTEWRDESLSATNPTS